MFKFDAGDKVICGYRLPYPHQWWNQPTVFVATVLEPDTDPKTWNGYNSEASYCLATGKLKLQYSWRTEKNPTGIMHDSIDSLFLASLAGLGADYVVTSEADAQRFQDMTVKSLRGQADKYLCRFCGKDGKPNMVNEWGQYKTHWLPMHRDEKGTYHVGPVCPDCFGKVILPVDNHKARELLKEQYEQAQTHGGVWRTDAGWVEWKGGVWLVHSKPPYLPS